MTGLGHDSGTGVPPRHDATGAARGGTVGWPMTRGPPGSSKTLDPLPICHTVTPLSFFSPLPGSRRPSFSLSRAPPSPVLSSPPPSSAPLPPSGHLHRVLTPLPLLPALLRHRPLLPPLRHCCQLPCIEPHSRAPPSVRLFLGRRPVSPPADGLARAWSACRAVLITVAARHG